MSVSVCYNNISWCFNCFYIFDESKNRLIFTSNSDTKHINILDKNNIVSGTISNNEKNILKVKGIQFTGETLKISDPLYHECINQKFNNKFLITHFKKLEFWYIDLSYVKMTDNLKGFGNKIYWHSDSNEI